MKNHKLEMALMLSVCIVAATRGQAQTLNFVSWGGALQEAQTRAFVAPFAAATGTKITQDSWSGELAKLRAMVDSGNVVWDVVDMDPQTAATACDQGLLEPIGLDPTYQSAGLVPGGVIECAIASSTYASILAFKKGVFSSDPTGIVDLFDTTRFPGKRSLRKSPVDALEAALIADGVALTDVYTLLATPKGVDRAFAKLDTIKSDIVWWEAGAQPAQLLMSGEVVLALAWNGRIADANTNEGADLGIAWKNHLRGFDMWSIPKGAKNLEAAHAFIRFTLVPQTNATISQYVAYGPAVAAAAPFIAPQVLENLPTDPKNSTGVLAQDGGFWAANSDALNARFSTWLAQ